MSPLTVSSDIKHTLRTLAHELGEKIKPTKQRPSDPARQEDTGLSKYVFYAPRKSDGKVPADFQDALSRAARETPNLTASEIFAEALQYANGPYGASNPAMDTFRDEVMENLAAEIRTDVDEGRLQPAHANLSTSARQNRAMNDFLDRSRPATLMEIARELKLDPKKIHKKYGDANNYYGMNFRKYRNAIANIRLDIIRNEATNLSDGDTFKESILNPESKILRYKEFELQYLYKDESSGGSFVGCLFKEPDNQERLWVVTYEGNIITLSPDEVGESNTQALGAPMILSSNLSSNPTPGRGTRIAANAVVSILRDTYRKQIENERNIYKTVLRADIDRKNENVIITDMKKGGLNIVPFSRTILAYKRGADYEELKSIQRQDLNRLKGNLSGLGLGTVTGMPAGPVGMAAGGAAGWIGASASVSLIPVVNKAVSSLHESAKGGK